MGRAKYTALGARLFCIPKATLQMLFVGASLEGGCLFRSASPLELFKFYWEGAEQIWPQRCRHPERAGQMVKRKPLLPVNGGETMRDTRTQITSKAHFKPRYEESHLKAFRAGVWTFENVQ